MNQARKRKSKWRWVKRSVFAVIFLVTLLAAVLVFENWRGRRAWATYRAGLGSQGQVLDWRAFLENDPWYPRSISFDEATGGADVAAELRSVKVLSDYLTVEGLSGAWRAQKTVDWSGINSLVESTSQMPMPEEFVALQESSEKFSDALVRRFSMATNEMRLIRRLGEHPISTFANVWTDPMSTSTSHLSLSMKYAVVALRLKAWAELDQKKSTAAMQDWRLMLDLGAALRGDPVLMSLLLQLAIAEVSIGVVWEGLALHQWNDAQLQQLQVVLQEINLVAEADRALRGERAAGLLALDKILADAKVPARWVLPALISNNKIAFTEGYAGFFPSTDEIQKRYVDVQRVQLFTEEMMENMRSGRFKPYRYMASILTPAIGKTLLKTANAQNTINMAMVACALERYWLARGEYPQTLEALLSDYLGDIPTDVDGEPLRYRLEPDGSFVLYSIGVDLKDDNGTVGETADEGDWVWRYPVSEE